jgi:tetraacyldisaccharide 4'-kinase
MLDFLRVLFIPLVPIYAFIIGIRNFLFDIGIFKSKNVNAKVLSVGNLTVGGSGKTPTVIYVTKLLKKAGIKVGVLSRGYGRTSKGYLLVSDGNEIKENVETCGDEIYQTMFECMVPAAVSENRVLGAEKLIKDYGINTIVLDDAFQHRWINRDLNILMFEQRFLLSKNRLRKLGLPTGNLREPFSAAKRADLIIINRKFSHKQNLPVEFQKYLKDKSVFTAFFRAIGFVDIKTHVFYKPEEFRGQKSLVVSAVANPYSFLNALRQIDIETTNKMIFRDHKIYTEDDIQNIRKQFYATNAQSVLTTHKDAVKLSQFNRESDDIDIYYLQIELDFDKKEEFDKYVLSKIK